MPLQNNFSSFTHSSHHTWAVFGTSIAAASQTVSRPHIHSNPCKPHTAPSALSNSVLPRLFARAVVCCPSTCPAPYVWLSLHISPMLPLHPVSDRKHSSLPCIILPSLLTCSLSTPLGPARRVGRPEWQTTLCSGEGLSQFNYH